MKEVLKSYKVVREGNLFFMLLFVIIGDYLYELRVILCLMVFFGLNGFFYFVVVVFDFFVFLECMVEYKI